MLATPSVAKDAGKDLKSSARGFIGLKPGKIIYRLFRTPLVVHSCNYTALNAFKSYSGCLMAC